MSETMESVNRHYPQYHHPAYIPVCPIHREGMVENSRRGRVIYFKCSRPGCNERGKAPIVEFKQSAGSST